MIQNILLVGLGGCLGSIARFLTAHMSQNLTHAGFPWGTFIANVAGCFIFGIIYGLSERFGVITPQWRLFLLTGICGGYTTFSAFTHENALFLLNANYLKFFTYTGLSLSLGLAALVLGIFLAKL